MQKPQDAYFKEAREWFYERYAQAHVQSNRWFVACLITVTLLALSLTAFICILPLKTFIPMVVHQNTITGEVWVTKPPTPYVPETDAQTQSDIVRYITSRESYSSSDINQRFNLVTLLSDSHIAKTYEAEQSNSNPNAPINILKEKGTRTVKIEDIVFIDKKGLKEIREFKQKSQNLAKVDFITTTVTPSGATETQYWVATIAWEYKGLPNNQQDAWDNWNGFQVTTYRVDPKNINQTK